MPKRQRAAANDAEDEPPELRSVLDWLRQQGSKFAGLQFRRGKDGVAAFARRKFAAGDELASLPSKCVLTADAASASEIGAVARASAVEWGVDAYCTRDSLLWIFMCVGRVEQSHPWHAYLSVLPPSPEPTCWPEEERAALSSTNVGASIAEARAEVERCHERFVAPLAVSLKHNERLLGA